MRSYNEPDSSKNTEHMTLLTIDIVFYIVVGLQDFKKSNLSPIGLNNTLTHLTNLSIGEVCFHYL